jgi:acetolactate synthase-1/2/3 large subunit
VLNNNGYGSIKSSQDNYFNGRRLGTDPSSGLGMPSIKGVVEGFGLRYSRIENNAALDEMLTSILKDNIPEIIEVIVDSKQTTEPRTTTTVDENGRLLTERMEVLSPKISTEELVEIMSISKPKN